ncbi:hypothetical protein HBH47_237890 [Parastagonospora nodorum]|nr:hypothetical protein HBH47_237890 [Parastagonospora nodorum]
MLSLLPITLTSSKALNITILLTYLKSALFFFSCYAVLCVGIIKPVEIFCFNSLRSLLTKLLYLLGLVNKDLKLLKQEISAGR